MMYKNDIISEVFLWEKSQPLEKFNESYKKMDCASREMQKNHVQIKWVM